MTKTQIIARFLLNAELSAEYAINTKKTTVSFDGREYSIPISDLPYYDALLLNLPEWHPFPKEKPEKDSMCCFVTRNFREESYIDEAIWITRKEDICFEENWEGPGFYKEVDGDRFKIEVSAWMKKPEPYKGIDKKRICTWKT